MKIALPCVYALPLILLSLSPFGFGTSCWAGDSKVVEFPEVDSATVRQWIIEAKSILVYEGGKHEEGGHVQMLKPGVATAELLTKTNFQFLPKDTVISNGAVVVGIQIDGQDGTIRHWYWPENHPSQIVGRLWGIANAASEDAP